MSRVAASAHVGFIHVSSGFNLSPQAMNIIMKRHSFGGRVGFDDFVGCCTKLRALTGERPPKMKQNTCVWLVENESVQKGQRLFFNSCFSDQFRRRDQQQTGTALFQYDDVSGHDLYVQCSLEETISGAFSS